MRSEACPTPTRTGVRGSMRELLTMRARFTRRDSSETRSYPGGYPAASEGPVTEVRSGGAQHRAQQEVDEPVGVAVDVGGQLFAQPGGGGDGVHEYAAAQRVQ